MVKQLKSNQINCKKKSVPFFQQLICYYSMKYVQQALCAISFPSCIKCHCICERVLVKAMPEALWVCCSVQ